MKNNLLQKWEPAHLAAVWFFVFSGFHLLWALGFYFGLPDVAKQAFQRRWFQIYNSSTMVFCILGGVLSLCLVHPLRSSWMRNTLLYGGWICAILLAIRGVGALAQVVYSLAISKFVFSPMLFWDLWFYIGTLLFLFAFIRYRKRIKNLVWRERLSINNRRGRFFKEHG